MMQETRALQAVMKMNAFFRSERRDRGIHVNLTLTSAVLLATMLSGCNRTRSADVLATVNGKAIMKSEVDKAYAAQLGEAQQQQQLSQEQSDSLRLNVLQALINDEILQQRAAKMNLTATNEEVDAKLAEMKAPYPNEDEFNQRLKANHTTIEEVKNDLRRSLTMDKLLNKEINSKITVSDADVTKYFNQHKSEFNPLETMYHLAQIQVTSIPTSQPVNLQGSKATNDEEAKKKIQALKNRLDSGEDFGTLAMNFSERPETASQGGDMGFVAESQMHADPDVYNAITKLKAGQITEILPLLDEQSKKVMGYAIYKLIAREPAGQRDVSDPSVQQAIRTQLQQGRSQLLKNAYFETLRDQAKVENFFAEDILKNDAR
jgi:peptidyl-prolyl cis-trans isomerase SurA